MRRQIDRHVIDEDRQVGAVGVWTGFGFAARGLGCFAVIRMVASGRPFDRCDGAAPGCDCRVCAAAPAQSDESNSMTHAKRRNATAAPETSARANMRGQYDDVNNSAYCRAAAAVLGSVRYFRRERCRRVTITIDDELDAEFDRFMKARGYGAQGARLGRAGIRRPHHRRARRAPRPCGVSAGGRRAQPWPRRESQPQPRQSAPACKMSTRRDGVEESGAGRSMQG
jgi:hypothetical protein